MENKKNTIISFKRKLIDARSKMNNPRRGGIDAFKKRNYVTLQDLYDATIPFLLEEGLLLSNFKDYRNEQLVLITRITDADSDESIETFSVLNPSLKIQDQGAELTYYQRYNLGCLLSIRTDFDDDAESIKSVDPIKKINKSQEAKIKELIGKDVEAWNMIKINFNLPKNLLEIPESQYGNIITALTLFNKNKEASNGK